MAEKKLRLRLERTLEAIEEMQSWPPIAISAGLTSLAIDIQSTLQETVEEVEK